jgi:hypothetical protein
MITMIPPEVLTDWLRCWLTALLTDCITDWLHYWLIDKSNVSLVIFTKLCSWHSWTMREQALFQNWIVTMGTYCWGVYWDCGDMWKLQWSIHIWSKMRLRKFKQGPLNIKARGHGQLWRSAVRKGQHSLEPSRFFCFLVFFVFSLNLIEMMTRTLA